MPRNFVIRSESVWILYGAIRKREKVKLIFSIRLSGRHFVKHSIIIIAFEITTAYKIHYTFPLWVVTCCTPAVVFFSLISFLSDAGKLLFIEYYYTYINHVYVSSVFLASGHVYLSGSHDVAITHLRICFTEKKKISQ